MSSQADYQAKDVSLSPLGSHFRVTHHGHELGGFDLSVPGVHNINNSLAAIAVARELDVDVEIIRTALRDFSGVQRRFQVKGEVNGTMIVDDYGHHPTEIKATLAAAKAGLGRRVVAVFQPHRYTRTQHLLEEFFTSFNQADTVIIMDIYAAGEQPISGVSGRAIYEGVKRHGHKDAAFLADRDAVVSHLARTLKKGDVLLTLGAGDVWKVGETLLEKLKHGIR
jgi:UDP-N-acetylmuramate--alanine ligase